MFNSCRVSFPKKTAMNQLPSFGSFIRNMDGQPCLIVDTTLDDPGRRRIGRRRSPGVDAEINNVKPRRFCHRGHISHPMDYNDAKVRVQLT